jgi:thermitase
MKSWKHISTKLNQHKLHVAASMLAMTAVGVTTPSFAMFTTKAVKANKNEKKAPEAVTGEYVVQLKSGVLSVQALSSQLSALGMKVVETVNARTGLQRVKVVKPALLAKNLRTSSFDPYMIRAETVNLLSDIPGVEFAEPNYIYRLASDLPMSLPNDPKFTQLWGMKNAGQADPSGRTGKTGADIKAPEAWNLAKGSRNVVVAIIDTGVDYTHPDLKNNIWSKEINGVKVHGYNAISGVLDPMDDHSHGTHCAGTIGGEGDNADGVTGVNWQVSIMGVKFLSAQGGGTLADAIKAIDWAVDQGANVLSNSWGGGGFSQALLDSIQRANDKGVIFIAASGNDSSNNDGAPSYPASYQVPNVVSVGASNNLDAMASFSNFGRSSVHLMAPGENVMSTVIGGSYASYSGTSMATPHVSGAVALLLSKEPSLNPVDIKERLMRTADKLKPYRTKLISGGRLNLYNLISDTTPPGFITIPDSAWSTPILQTIRTKSPYDASTSQRWEITQPGAKFIRIHFASFKTEGGYDFLRIKDKGGNLIDELSGNLGNNFFGMEVEGDTVVLEFNADDSVQDLGFVVDSMQWTDFVGAQN